MKQFTKQRIPEAYVRMLLRAWEFSSTIFGEDMNVVEEYLVKCDSFKEPREGKLDIKEQ